MSRSPLKSFPEPDATRTTWSRFECKTLAAVVTFVIDS